MQLQAPSPGPNVYRTTVKDLRGGVVHVKLSHVDPRFPHGRPVDFREAMRLLRSGDNEFMQLMLTTLRELGGSCCLWEHPPVTRSSVRRPYEFIVAQAPSLRGMRANDGPFREHFRLSGREPGSSCVFTDLARTCILVAPSAAAGVPIDDYAHLASFVSSAPKAQAVELLQTIGSSMLERLEHGDSPVYLSTSGLGLPWLHVRLDVQPKYYTFHRYRHADPESEQSVALTWSATTTKHRNLDRGQHFKLGRQRLY